MKRATRNWKLLLCALGVLCGGTRASAVDRDAFTFTAYDLQIQIDSRQQDFTATGTVTVRNDSASAQKNIVLQISSSLQWNTITSDHKKVAYVTHPYSSDVDHTGVLSEAVITLAQPVPRGGTVQLELSYGGTIPADTTRLDQLGTPKDAASASDWDRVSPQFTALRGVGYVAWYPISLNDISLSDGQEYSAALAEWRARHADTKFSVEVKDLHSVTGEVALFTPAEGPPVDVNPSAKFVAHALGLDTPTLIVAPYVSLKAGTTNSVLYYAVGDKDRADDFARIVESAESDLKESFGRSGAATVIELPEGTDAPFESDGTLLAPLITSDPKQSALVVVHQLARSMMLGAHPAMARRPWIYEGIGGFVQALMRERADGRDAALAWVGQQRDALVEEEAENRRLATLATPTKPFSDASTSLVSGTDEVLYRTKAMYVWWMLRDMLGEGTITRAITKYNPEADKDPAYMQHLIEQQAQLDRVATKLPLEQFFDDWVYRDRDLPDFIITSTFARKVLAAAGGDNYMVTVTVKNLGDAGAEVPLTISAAQNERITKRISVAARGEASIRIPTVNVPDRAIVNDGSVPESDVGNNAALIEVSPGVPSSP